MDTSELLELIEKGEDSQTQFKERFESIDAMAAEICAFSNSKGGNIIVGVSDDGNITGLKKEELQRLLQSSGHLYADEIPVENTNLNDINIDMFKSFYERRTHEKLEDLNSF